MTASQNQLTEAVILFTEFPLPKMDLRSKKRPFMELDVLR
jgi:hypothetical protein